MSKQLSLKRTSGWGGRRKNAGRPNKSNTVNHMKREQVSARHPQLITLKLRGNLPNLRQKRLFKEFQTGIQLAGRLGFRVIQYSLQSNHIHLLVEAKDHTSLARGVQSLAGRLAKILRKLVGGRGSVFSGRYHRRALKTPTEMKRALQYVLLNTAKHLKMIEHLDPFSSGVTFAHWPQLIGQKFAFLIKHEVEIWAKQAQPIQDVFDAQTWLASVGWMRSRL